MRRLAAALLLAFTLVFPISAAYAQYVAPTPTEVAPSDTHRASPQTEVRGTRFQRDLPVTGGDVLMIAVIGAIAVGGGAAVRRASRAPRP